MAEKKLHVLSALIALTLGSCTTEARVYPMDPAAMAAGVPKFEFTSQGTGQGPVTVTMPNGEILHGEFQVTENEALAMSIVGSHLVTGVGFGAGRKVVVSATGEKTILNCIAEADLGGHGSGICETSQGNRYRVMF